jgi:hypothetical protein
VQVHPEDLFGANYKDNLILLDNIYDVLRICELKVQDFVGFLVFDFKEVMGIVYNILFVINFNDARKMNGIVSLFDLSPLDLIVLITLIQHFVINKADSVEILLERGCFFIL